MRDIGHVLCRLLLKLRHSAHYAALLQSALGAAIWGNFCVEQAGRQWA